MAMGLWSLETKCVLQTSVEDECEGTALFLLEMGEQVPRAGQRYPCPSKSLRGRPCCPLSVSEEERGASLAAPPCRSQSRQWQAGFSHAGTRRFAILGGIEGPGAAHLLHRDQPRPSGADDEAAVPASPPKEGCKGRQLSRVDPNHSRSGSESRQGKQNYISQKAVRPLAAPPHAPSPRPSSGCYIRAEWPGPAQSAEAALRPGRLRSRRDAAAAAGTRRPALLCPEASFAPRGRAPQAPRALQLRGPEAESGLGRGVPAGIRAGAGDAQPRRARRRVQAGCSPGARRRDALAGARGARRTRLNRAPTPDPGVRPWETPARVLGALSARPERRGRPAAP